MSNAGVVALFVRLRWKMLRGALNGRGAQKWAVAIGLIAVWMTGGSDPTSAPGDVADPSAIGADGSGAGSWTVEVIDARTDKPITSLKTTVTRDDGTVALEGTALCYTMPIPNRAGGS